MKQYLVKLQAWIEQDDLFLCSVMFCAGVALFSIASVVLVFGVLPVRWQEFSGWTALLSALGLALGLWGALLMVGSFLSKTSWVRRFAEKAIPDSADLEGLVLAFVLCLPAAVMTYFLRQMGVRKARS